MRCALLQYIRSYVRCTYVSTCVCKREEKKRFWKVNETLYTTSFFFRIKWCDVENLLSRGCEQITTNNHYIFFFFFHEKKFINFASSALFKIDTVQRIPRRFYCVYRAMKYISNQIEIQSNSTKSFYFRLCGLTFANLQKRSAYAQTQSPI